MGADSAKDSAIYSQFKAARHQVDDTHFSVLDREECYFERGVRAAIWERVEQPTLNKRGVLRFKLSKTWDQALQRLPRRSRDVKGIPS